MHPCTQLPVSGSLTQQPGRPHDQVVVSATESWLIAAEGKRSVGSVLTLELIGEINALHHHGEFVEPVIPQAQHLEMQIDLGRSSDADRSRHEQDIAKSAGLRPECEG